MSERTDMIRSVLTTAIKQSATGARIVGQQSKKQMQIRNLTQRKNTLYQKLGKEVEQLVIQGDLSHPGLQRALEHLAKVDEELAALTGDGSIVKAQSETE